MKEIILHIGHGKTGTTATQMFLAKNSELLRKHGIYYDEHRSLPKARAGLITSGNINSHDPDWFKSQIIRNAKSQKNYTKFLYSSEVMFDLHEELIENILRYKNKHHFTLILSVRNPVEMLSSHYVQAVKRAGYIKTIEEYEPVEKTIIKSLNLIKLCSENDIDIKLLNYSFHKKEITGKILELLGLESIQFGNMDDQYQLNLNRSLNKSELKLIIEVNRVLGRKFGQLLSDNLVEQLPDVTGDSVHIPIAVYEKFKARVTEAVNYVNKHLPQDEQLTLEYIQSDKEDDDIHLNQSQIGLILALFKRRIFSPQFEFDEKSYLQKNPDVKKAGADPYRHFLIHGIREGRDF